MNMSFSRSANSESTRDLAMIIQGQLTKVVSRAIQSVAFVENDSMAMTNYMFTAERNMRNATSATGGTTAAILSIMSTTNPLRSIFERTISCVWTKSVWRRNLWSSSLRWT